jgi:hypothetical protein
MSTELINEKIKWLKSSNDLRKSKPTMRIADFLQEAEILYEWCQEDKKELMKVSLTWQLVEDLPVRAGALRKIHARCTKEFKSLTDSQKQWKDASLKGKALRKKLERYISFILRDIPNEYAKIRKIKKGNTNADLIQNLNTLSVLGSMHKEKLEEAGMNLNLLDLASAESENLLDLYGTFKSSARDSPLAYELRNKAYHHLKQAMDEIRRRGKLALQDYPDRLKGYSSDYIRRMNQKSKNKGKHPENGQ